MNFSESEENSWKLNRENLKSDIVLTKTIDSNTWPADITLGIPFIMTCFLDEKLQSLTDGFYIVSHTFWKETDQACFC